MYKEILEAGLWCVQFQNHPSNPHSQQHSYRATYVDHKLFVMPPPGPVHKAVADWFNRHMNVALYEQASQNVRYGGYSVFLNKKITLTNQVTGKIMQQNVPDVGLGSPPGGTPTGPLKIEVACSQSTTNGLLVMDGYMKYTDTFGGWLVDIKEPQYRRPTKEPWEEAPMLRTRFKHSTTTGYTFHGMRFGGPYTVTLHIYRQGKPVLVVVKCLIYATPSSI